MRSPDKIAGRILSKVMRLPSLAAELKHSGRGKVVLCHGMFDILHIGHIRYLEAAERMGDTLVVTVTSDRFVNKGEGRPFFPEQLRAEALAALRCTDYIAINDAPNALAAIHLIKPDLFVKGPECRTHKTPGLLEEEAAIQAVGGKMAFTDGEIFSSSEIGRKVLALS